MYYILPPLASSEELAEGLVEIVDTVIWFSGKIDSRTAQKKLVYIMIRSHKSVINLMEKERSYYT